MDQHCKFPGSANGPHITKFIVLFYVSPLFCIAGIVFVQTEKRHTYIQGSHPSIHSLTQTATFLKHRLLPQERVHLGTI